VEIYLYYPNQLWDWLVIFACCFQLKLFWYAACQFINNFFFFFTKLSFGYEFHQHYKYGCRYTFKIKKVVDWLVVFAWYFQPNIIIIFPLLLKNPFQKSKRALIHLVVAFSSMTNIAGYISPGLIGDICLVFNQNIWIYTFSMLYVIWRTSSEVKEISYSFAYGLHKHLICVGLYFFLYQHSTCGLIGDICLVF